MYNEEDVCAVFVLIAVISNLIVVFLWFLILSILFLKI